MASGTRLIPAPALSDRQPCQLCQERASSIMCLVSQMLNDDDDIERSVAINVDVTLITVVNIRPGGTAVSAIQTKQKTPHNYREA